MECAKPELELFSSRPFQFSVIKTEQICLRPVNSLTNSTVIEFRDNSYGDSYKDLSSIFFRLKLKLNKKVETANKIAFANCTLSSLFQQVQVYLNNTLISQNSSNYGYRAYLESILNFTNEEASQHLDGSGFAMDQPGGFDEVDATKNTGFSKRSKLATDNEIELVGRLHCDVLNQMKYLMNNVELRIVLTMAKQGFFIICDAQTDHEAQITDAALYLNHVTLNPEVLLAHHTVLQQKNAIYPYKKVEVKNFTIGSGLTNFSLDNVILGTLPSTMIIAMLETDRYNGIRTKNPYKFDHFKMNRFEVAVNGIQLMQPLTMDYTTPTAIRSNMVYHQLFRGINYHRTDKAHNITKELFDDGAFMIAYDLSPDHNDICNNPLKTGALQISAQFSDALTSSITILVYLQYDAELMIDKDYVIYPTMY